MNEALNTVIRAFQADVQRGLALFRQHTGSDNLLSWRSRRLPLSGHLDPEQRHHYSFHGIGVRLQLAPDLHIDWDFGHDGRMDGFDHWRLQQFIEERPELQRVLPLSSLRSVFDAAVRDGSIVSPWRAQHDNLYYIADEQPTGVNINDYLLEHTGWQWRDLLQHWTWLLPPRFTVWMVNRFGDLFIRLDDGTIHHLDTGSGTLRKVAATRDEFCAICDDPQQANFFLMVPLVDELVAAGRTLRSGECYSYQLVPAFEGAFTPDNVVVRPIADHYNIFGPQHLLTKDIPDGTSIEFTTPGNA